MKAIESSFIKMGLTKQVEHTIETNHQEFKKDGEPP
jgi:hypothetical protein